MHVVICFGDSLVYGEKDIEAGGWVERLRLDALQHSQYLDYQTTLVYNLGIASENTDGLKKRISQEVAARKIHKKACSVILSYGLNDIKIHKNKNIVPLSYFECNLKESIELAKAESAEVYLLTMPPISLTIDGKVDVCGNLRFADDVERYNLLIRQLSDSHECKLIDINRILIEKEDMSFLSSDGLHLNATGHKNVFETLKSVLTI